MPRKFLWHMQNLVELNKRKTERFFELTIKIKSLCYFFAYVLGEQMLPDCYGQSGLTKESPTAVNYILHERKECVL